MFDLPSLACNISDLTTRSATEKSSSSTENQLKPPPPNYITSPTDPVAPSPVASDVTNFEDVDEEVEEEEAERTSAADFAANFNAAQRPSVTSPLREALAQLGATPLRV